jgi:hypothetical protein
VTDEPGPLEILTAAELKAVATLWRRERRELVTSFTGTSMLPAISPGQRVVVECGVEPEIDEVVVVRFNNQLGVHRIAARGSDWVLTWGDANRWPDPPIEAACVVGTIRNVPASPRSAHRALLLWFLLTPTASFERVRRRVQFLHGARTAWAQGPLVFVGKSLRAVFCRPRQSR